MRMLTDTDKTSLKDLESRLLWLSSWIIHNANHIRPNAVGLKVGGHQASCASMVSILTALYFRTLRPEDRVAVKPHAAPLFHAMQYLMGNQTREKLEKFRGFGGAQSYPSRTKDIDDVDFSTGSVGLGVAITAFASLVQDYLAAKPWAQPRPKGRMIALVGDAELDEGNVYECLQEGWKNDLRNTWWIIDYNRQSLDSVVSRRALSAAHRRRSSSAVGWEIVHPEVRQEAGTRRLRPAGRRGACRDWIADCPNDALFGPLTFKGGAAWREAPDERRSSSRRPATAQARSPSTDDEGLHALMTNLGGPLTSRR